MALTKAQIREILSEAGVDGEKMSIAVDKIIEGHKASIDALREERDTLKADAEKLPAIQKELDELKKAGGKEDAWKSRFDAKAEEFDKLKKEYAEFKDGVSAKEAKAKKKDAYRSLLKKAGVSEKHIDDILNADDRLGEVDKVEFSDDGAIKNEDSFMDSIKKNWSSRIETVGTKGADTPTPPANNGGSSQKGEAAKIAQRVHENLFGKTEEAK